MSPYKRSSQNFSKITSTTTYEQQQITTTMILSSRLHAYPHILRNETPEPERKRPCTGRVITCACFLNRAQKTFPETDRHLCALWRRDPKWPHKPQAQATQTPDGDLDPNKHADYLLAVSINMTACLVSTIPGDNRGNIYITKTMSPIIINKQPSD